MTGPLSHLDEYELLRRAARAMDLAAAAGPGTLVWAIQWTAYDTVMTELDGRAIALVSSSAPGALGKLRAVLAASPRHRGVPCPPGAGRPWALGGPPGLSPGSGGPA